MNNKMKVSDITNYLESIAPAALQESYDNAGLIIGNYNSEITGVLISLDITEEIIDEAIERNLNMIISHHPIVFSGIKRFNGNNYVERCVIKAIKNNIAIYSAHTNIDAVIQNGVNTKIGEKIGLKNTRILSPVKGVLNKIAVFVPQKNAEQVRTAMFNAGAGKIGNYDSCSFNIDGKGTFKGNEATNPHAGKKGELHTEQEVKIETIVPSYLTNKVVSSMINAHPYEEVAYDVYKIENEWTEAGSGMIGELEKPEDAMVFLNRIKEIFGCGCIKYTEATGKTIQKVALCGGSGSFLLNNAKREKADIFITGDFKYHQFFDADNQIIIADIGHYESEQYTKELFYELLTKKFSNFAVCLTNISTNPIKYL